MHSALLLLIILTAGLTSQWIAAVIRIPAIVILICSGLLLGPISGIIELHISQYELSELIGLGIAIILFEGGMDLKIAEYRRISNSVKRLIILGPPITWVLTAFSAHYIGNFSWPVACVLGAVLVVTGPTVILPLLRQARLNKESASLLKWEAIVNDPIGVLLAVLTFQYFTAPHASISEAITNLGLALLAAIVFGGLGGYLTSWLYKRGSVPSHLKAPILLVLVLICYWASNLIQHEAGLLSVTLMGVIIGNIELAEVELLQRFKENLTILLLSVLFIIIPAQLEFSQLALIDLPAILFVLAVIFLVRPLSIAISTCRDNMSKEDKILMGWIAPRGIVAAATASVFGPALANAGYTDAEKLLPVVFLIIISTVLLHGLTITKLAQYLNLAAKEDNGLLIVGGNTWTLALAKALQKINIDVLVLDGAYQHLPPFRMSNIKVFYGELLSEEAEHELESEHLGYLLCATENDYYNALICKAQGRHFGHHRTFQFSTHLESDIESKRLPLKERGHFAFHPDADFKTLHQDLERGWEIRTTKLSNDFTYKDFKKQRGIPNEDWLLLGSVSPKGRFRLYTLERKFFFSANWTLIYFAKASENITEKEDEKQ